MKVHEFFGAYANVPLPKRMIPLNFYTTGNQTLDDIRCRIHDLEEEIRPKRIEQDRLIGLVKDFVLKNQAGDYIAEHHPDAPPCPLSTPKN